MNSVVSLRLDSEYSADRIARLFPKCKPKSSSSSSGTANASSSRLPLSPSSSSSNGTAISSSSSSTNGTISQSLPPPQQQQQQQHQHQSNVVENSKNMIVVNEVSSSLMDRNSPTVSTNGIRGSIESCETVEPNCNGTSVITEDSCSQASSYDMSNDEDSEEVPTPPSYRHSKSLSVHSMVNNNTITDNRDYRKPSKITAQYKLRDSRIIEIAGGRELYSQSRSKACRKSRSVDNDKGKLGRVWELRAKINNEKDSDGTREITETVFGSEIKSVKHQHIQSSYGVRGSVVFDDIGDNWRADQYSSSYSIQRTYHPNVTSLSQNFNQEIKTTSNNNEDRADNPSVITVPNHNNISNNNSNSYSNSNNNNNNNNNNSIEEIRDNNKLSLPHVIGNLPIAQYDGSPRRYGQRSAENMMPTLLSSPTMSAPRPGFPQRVVDNGGSTDGSTSPTLPVSNSSASMATFNYLYEYSETRKVLEEFFKDSDSQEKSEQQFQELEYELKRRKSPTSSTSYSRGNSYVGLRLADPTDNSSHCSPRKQSQDSSDGSVNNQDQGFMSSYTVSSENLGLSIDCNLPPTSIKPSAHHRFSLSPETERRFGQNRNFAMSPDTTDCDSNFGEGDSDVSSLMLIHDSESNVHQTNNNQLDRLYPSMPILEDGLSSGQNSDTEANNPTVLLMKKQITEIEREIIERNNRLPTTSNSNSANIVNSGSSSSVSTIIASSTAASTVISTPTNNITSIMSQSNNSSCSNGQNSYANIITSVSVPSPYPIVNNTENTSTSDIDLNSLDPLAIIPDRCNASPPPPAPVAHRDVRHQSVAVSSQINNSSCVEDTIKDIRMTLSRTKALPIRAASCIVNGDMEKESVSSNSKPENPVWIPRKKSSISGQSADEDEPDTDLETDRLLGQQRTDDQGFFDDKIDVGEENKKKAKNKEGLFHEPSVLIEGVLFRARYLGSTQLVCEGQPTKATRMMQAEEAVSRIKAPDGESQPSTDVDLFISTEKIMVLNTDLKEIMMDHALRTISYIADIGDLVVLMARRRFVPHDVENPPKINRTPKMICHVFESDEAQFIAQSIGQAFQVAYMEFLKANGIEDHSFVKEMDYQEVLNSQEIFGDELQMFARKELQKEVVVPKMKGEILGVVIVESGWGSMLPTVVIANLAPSGAAARCGQLNIGDQIIAINGVSLVGLPLSTCQNYIKNSKPHTVIKLTVVPCAPVVEVKIKRPDTKYQLGFSVQNGVICSLLRGGIAERGGVRVGHRIIEINNQSVVAVPHEKIVTLLATSVGEILMKTMPTSMFRLLTGQETPAFI